MRNGRPQKKRSRKVTWILNIAIVVCLGVLIYALVNIFLIQKEYGDAENFYKPMQIPEVRDALEGLGDSDDIEEEVLLTLYEKVHSLAEENSDFVAYIYIPGTNIEYPVVQGADNDYYLRRMFDHTYNSSGSIFMDFRADPELTYPNTIIYGHNMHNGTMFENLIAVKDNITGYSDIYLITTDSVYRYEIFAARHTDINDACYIMGFADEAAQQAFFDETSRGAISMAPGDRVVTLSTCTYEIESDERIIVQGVLRRVTPLLKTTDLGQNEGSDS